VACRPGAPCHSSTDSADEVGGRETYADLVGLIGFAVFACSIFLWAARLIVVAIKMTLAQSSATEGSVFWESHYYQNVFWMHFHYLVIGCASMAIRRMIGDR